MGDQHSLSQSPDPLIPRNSCLLHHRAGRFVLRLFRSKQSFEQSEIRNNRSRRDKDTVSLFMGEIKK